MEVDQLGIHYQRKQEHNQRSFEMDFYGNRGRPQNTWKCFEVGKEQLERVNFAGKRQWNSFCGGSVLS